MKTADLHIPSPCTADWNAMEGDHRSRFCAQCEKRVTDLSVLTEQDALAFLDANPGACVVYTAVDEDVVFAPPPRLPGRPWMAVAAGSLLALATPALASGSAADPSLSARLWAWWTGEPVEQVVSTGTTSVPTAPLVIPEVGERIEPVRQTVEVTERPTPPHRTRRLMGDMPAPVKTQGQVFRQ
ncbi:MAG: hypothetical protein KC656_25630 [Myxococcales bacterium]|nr:hypothetical protein [Myxococcales bacterium]